MIGYFKSQIDAFRPLWPVGMLGVGCLLFAAAIPFVFEGAVVAWAILALLVLIPLMGVTLAHHALPPGLIVLALLYGGSFGGLRMHLIPVFVVLAAGLLRAQSTGQSVSRRDMVLAGAGAGLLSLLLAGVVLRPRPQGGGGGGGSGRNGPADQEPADPGRLGELFDRLLRALGLDGDGQASERVERGEATGGRQEPNSSVNWQLLLALFLLVLLLLLLAWLIHRWRSGRSSSGGTSRWALIQRFESVGEEAGTPRQESQGLVAYGDGLSSTGDDRPRHAGSALSGLLYDPSARDAEYAERLVTSLETNPLPRVAPTKNNGWLQGVRSRFRSHQ